MAKEKVIVTKTDLLKHKKLKPKDKLNKLIESEKVLLSVTTVFPFTLFPNTIVITDEKISIIDKLFFYSKQIRSVLIKDIATVQAETSIFFGKIIIIDKNFQALPIIVSYLRKEDALEARRLIQGLIVLAREELDITDIETPNPAKTLEKLGSSQTDES